jgi:hypothetical protein
MRLLRVWLILALVAGCQTLPTGPVTRFDPPVRSITLADWTADGYAQASAIAALDGIAATGANHVTIIVTAYQSTATSSAIRADDPRTPVQPAVATAIAAAQTRGLAVTLKPHVDVDDGAWRGTIRPDLSAAWFADYSAFVVQWAQFAETRGVATFVVGTELARTISSSSEWRGVIAEVRGVFNGRLTYAASWDEAQKVKFWDVLDIVGVDAYFPIAPRDDAGRLDLLAGWEPWLQRLQLLHHQTGKKIMMTEIGYRSIDGAGLAPFSFGGNGSLDLQEQADLYWAALEATGDKPWIEGMDWWNWRADGSGGPANLDYTPEGKPAEEQLRSAWAGP